MSRVLVLSKTERYGLQAHLMIYLLATVAILLLLYEQSQLATRINGQSADLEQIVVQQAVLAVLLGFLLGIYGRIRGRWLYILFALLFAGYAGTRLTAAFSQTIGLVPALENKGVPISDYQGTFYSVALAAAICYLLSILLLRRSFGRLSVSQARDAS